MLLQSIFIINYSVRAPIVKEKNPKLMKIFIKFINKVLFMVLPFLICVPSIDKHKSQKVFYDN